MLSVWFILLSLLCGSVPNGHIHYPDRSLTPGQAAVAASVCGVLPARQVSASLKRQVCQAYGITSGCPGQAWEIDHFIPRELGGLDVAANLWPQPIAEAHLKDRLENLLHKAVCTGRLSLTDAQACIANDWYACWECWNSAHCPMGDGL